MRALLKPSFFFLIAAMPFSAVYAQHDFSLTGAIFENGSKLRIALAEITNLRTKVTVGSNDMGLFTIKAQDGDTLLITKRLFRDVKVLASDRKDFVVYLNRDNTLQEVVIYGKNKKQELNEIKKDFKQQGSFYGGKPPLLSFFGAPLTFFYELFGATPKRARRFGRMYQTEIEQLSIDQYFNKLFIAQHSALKPEQIDDYMVIFRPEYAKAKTWTQYDYMTYILRSSKKYTDSVSKVK